MRSAVSRYIQRAWITVLITIGTPRRGRRSRRLPPPGEGSMQVLTFVTDEAEYAEMRGSFINAGFDPEAFVRLTDRETDPYRVITSLGMQDGPRYVVLCHQDVRADLSSGAHELLEALAELDERDPAWTVAGNAGVTRRLCLVRRLNDPHGGSTRTDLPVSVMSLDENFLVFNRRSTPRCSPGLSGFHHYGTDVCLNALADGGSAYVIDFPVTHLGVGRLQGTYGESKERLIEAWNPRCVFRYVGTTTEVLFFSRFAAVRGIFASPRAVRWVSNYVWKSLDEWHASFSAADSSPR